MDNVTVAVTQMACTWESEDNIERAENLVRQAAAAGAHVVLLPELFATPYFCKDRDEKHLHLAAEANGHPLVTRFARLAASLGVVLPVSFFERQADRYYNSLAMVDADGTVMGVYRKSHIPDGPGYWEKFYFSPGDTGFMVWKTRFGVIGAGICWDQWFPEAARAMTLAGANLLLYPTAIGSEPAEPELDTRERWQRVQRGHAVANAVVLAASNRVGMEQGQSCGIRFYGSSFVAGPDGSLLAQGDQDSTGFWLASFSPAELERTRRSWGFFRDRRPELYGPLLAERSPAS